MKAVASVAPKAPKPPTKAELAAQAEQDRLEVIATIEAVPEWVRALVQPLSTLLVAGPKAVKANTSYSRKVLGLITRGLTRVHLVPDIMSQIYTNMTETVAVQVGTIASEEVSEEQAAKRVTAAAKKMSDAGGPFWRICAIIAIDGKAGITSLLEQVEAKNASLGRLNTWTTNRINTLVFDPSRGSTQCSYALRDGVQIDFTIEDATITWDHYQAEVAHTKKLHEEHSQEWSAARRQFRVEHPADMPDGRSKQEQGEDMASAARAEARADRAIVLAMTDNERTEVSARLLSEATTEV